MVAAVSNTVLGIIGDAMVDAGLLDEGEEPSSEQLASNMRRLCDIINVCQIEGIKLFLQEEITVNLVDGTNSYTITAPTVTPPAKHLRVLQGRIEDTDGNTRPVNPISWQEWNQLQQVSEGTVVSYFVDKQVSNLVVKVWNTPDAAEAENSLILLIHRQVLNPINLTENIAFPQEWRIYLRWALADDISTGQPQAIMDRCSERAQYYKELLEGWDVEDTPTRFTFEGGGQTYGSFN